MTDALSDRDELLYRLRENIGRIRSDIAALAPGRSVTLLGATKTVPAEIINLAVKECGLTDIGENRVQELIEKYPSLEREGLKIHFIGRLQINKVKYLTGRVSMIHSVDSLPLAHEIDRRSAAAGSVTEVLIELNSGLEQGKGGINPARTKEFLESLAEFGHIKVRGIMTIAPVCPDPEQYNEYFGRTKEIFDRAFTGSGAVLSMGMSDSYRQALANGSTLIRIGSAIFGKRTVKTE